MKQSFSMGDMITPPHFVRFYNDGTCLAKEVSHFIGTGLEAGHAGIIIATKPLLDSIEQRLSARGLDVAAARMSGQYVPLDAAQTLSQFMVDGWPDEERFLDVVGKVMTCAADNHSRTRAFGEMVALLVADHKSGAAIRLEQLWNSLNKDHSFSLFCAYPMSPFDGANNGFHDICAEHAAVLHGAY